MAFKNGKRQGFSRNKITNECKRTLVTRERASGKYSGKKRTIVHNLSVSSTSRKNFIAPKSHLTSSSLKGSSLMVLLVANEVSVAIFEVLSQEIHDAF